MFDQLCPTYMVYGMTYEQYWFGDPYMVSAFKDAYLLRRKIENENLWIAGAYVYQAVAVAITNCFSNTQAKYIDKPFPDMFPKTKAEREAEEVQRKNQLIQQLSLLQARFNARHKKGVDEDGNNP